MTSHAPLVRRCSSKSRLEKQKEVVEDEGDFLPHKPVFTGEKISADTVSVPTNEPVKPNVCDKMNPIAEVSSPPPVVTIVNGGDGDAPTVNSNDPGVPSKSDVSFYFLDEDSTKTLTSPESHTPQESQPTTSAQDKSSRVQRNLSNRFPLTSSASFDDACRYLTRPSVMVKQSSLASAKSFESSSPALSRDSSIEYTDSTGVDLEEFLKMTLNKCHKDRFFLLKLESELSNFILKENKSSHKFLPMSSYNRMLVHRVAAFYGLDHNIDNSGKSIVVTKTPNTRIPDFRLKDHLATEFTCPEERKRHILKRDLSGQDEKLFLRQRLLDERRNKSFEEREETYLKVRDRIFKSPESFTSSQEYLMDSSRSFSRLSAQLPVGSDDNVNLASLGSDGDLNGRLHTFSLDDSKAAKGVSAGPLPFSPDDLVLVAVHPSQVVPSSLVYSPKDGQPYKNLDGSLYRHNPSLLPPYHYPNNHINTGLFIKPTNQCETHVDLSEGQFSQVTVLTPTQLPAHGHHLTPEDSVPEHAQYVLPVHGASLSSQPPAQPYSISHPQLSGRAPMTGYFSGPTPVCPGGAMCHAAAVHQPYCYHTTPQAQPTSSAGYPQHVIHVGHPGGHGAGHNPVQYVRGPPPTDTQGSVYYSYQSSYGPTTPTGEGGQYILTPGAAPYTALHQTAETGAMYHYPYQPHYVTPVSGVAGAPLYSDPTTTPTVPPPSHPPQQITAAGPPQEVVAAATSSPQEVVPAPSTVQQPIASTNLPVESSKTEGEAKTVVSTNQDRPDDTSLELCSPSHSKPTSIPVMSTSPVRTPDSEKPSSSQ